MVYPQKVGRETIFFCACINKKYWFITAKEICKSHCPTKLFNTLSSFSNQDEGGILIFGVDESDNYAIKGSYVRVGESDELMSEYEIYSYEAFRKRTRDDILWNLWELPVEVFLCLLDL